MGLQNTVMSSDEKILGSQRASMELIRAMKGESGFSTTDILQAVKEEIRDGRKTRDDVNEAKVEVIVDTLDTFDHHQFLRAKQTGSYMNIQGTTVTGTVLSAMVFCVFLCTCYNVNPPNLQNKFNGFFWTFSICHRLSCRNVGIIITRHIEVRGGLL